MSKIEYLKYFTFSLDGKDRLILKVVGMVLCIFMTTKSIAYITKRWSIPALLGRIIVRASPNQFGVRLKSSTQVYTSYYQNSWTMEHKHTSVFAHMFAHMWVNLCVNEHTRYDGQILIYYVSVADEKAHEIARHKQKKVDSVDQRSCKIATLNQYFELTRKNGLPREHHDTAKTPMPNTPVLHVRMIPSQV